MKLKNLLPTSSKIALAASALALSVFSAGDLFAAVTQSQIKLKAGVWPVMVRLDYNPVLQIALEGAYDAKLSELKLDFTKSTNVSDIEEVDVYVGGSADKAGTFFGKAKPTKNNPIVTVKGSKPASVSDGRSVWVSVKMREGADITGTLTCVGSQIVVDGKPLSINGVPATQRIGYAVTKTGDLGSKNYRIPAITATKAGTLVGTFDIRYGSAGDLPGNIDIGVSTSSDGGKTWTKVKSVLSSKNMKVNKGVGDPGILYDPKTNTVWIAALWAPQSGHPIWTTVAGSTSEKNCGQMLLIKSTNEGKTWSKEINITEDIKRLKDSDTARWGLVFQGPGAGIVTKDGTLIFPGQIWMRNAANNKTDGEGASRGVLIYSKDNGKHWTSTVDSPAGGSESTCVEKKNGEIVLNSRTNKGWGRTGSIYDKKLKTVKPDPNLQRGAKGNLNQPGGCQASLLSVGNDWFFSNPKSGKRDHMTIRYSKNEGDTWSGGLLYEERETAGYSSLVPVGKDRIGVLYEGIPKNEVIAFLSIPIDEIKKAK